MGRCTRLIRTGNGGISAALGPLELSSVQPIQGQMKYNGQLYGCGHHRRLQSRRDCRVLERFCDRLDLASRP
jgi:hypothetical protein